MDCLVSCEQHRHVSEADTRLQMLIRLGRVVLSARSNEERSW